MQLKKRKNTDVNTASCLDVSEGGQTICELVIEILLIGHSNLLALSLQSFSCVQICFLDDYGERKKKLKSIWKDCKNNRAVFDQRNLAWGCKTRQVIYSKEQYYTKGFIKCVYKVYIVALRTS